MPRLKLILEYDGTSYVGWQAQENGPSIHREVERAVGSLLGEQVAIVAAARTDSGVHAAGQVVCFSTQLELPLKAYWMGLNRLLPKDISVVAAAEVPESFDPRRLARGKRYRYLIFNRRTPSALRRRTHWQIFQPLDVASMQAAGALLLGRRDFSAFRAADCQASHAIRELRTVSISGEAGGEIAVSIEGTAFLKHMVRNIVGTLVEVGRGHREIEWVKDIRDSLDRRRSGPTAPPQGLTLMEVRYPEDPSAPPENELEEAALEEEVE
ncbi:MAG TPA: tRNA pseudouridine(38-40) synthase TruA [Myxococcaceae bacterium]|nr:tRNA pseudouridine(38-40) synthase TruA [Myxococcaceae bacterium]